MERELRVLRLDPQAPEGNWDTLARLEFIRAFKHRSLWGAIHIETSRYGLAYCLLLITRTLQKWCKFQDIGISLSLSSIVLRKPANMVKAAPWKESIQWGLQEKVYTTVWERQDSMRNQTRELITHGFCPGALNMITDRPLSFPLNTQALNDTQALSVPDYKFKKGPTFGKTLSVPLHRNTICLDDIKLWKKNIVSGEILRLAKIYYINVVHKDKRKK